MSERTHCNKPDRHEPRLECGYPLPCPHHTIVVEVKNLDEAPKKVRQIHTAMKVVRARLKARK